jgi:transposase-like protein
MPMSQELVEQSKEEIPEFDFPVCPKCGAEDPVLENADPVNSWLCEECGNQWADSQPV